MMIQDEYIPVAPVRRSPLDRRFRIDRVGPEVLFYAALFAISVFLHLWDLGYKAMHHDESIHAWMSYKFFTGSGSFTCAGGRSAPTYCYDPVYHGPSLYVLTLLSYFLFGDGDAQARLPMALAGIALVPMAWTLRPYIGRSGALLAAILMTISPSILYYTRFARHDALVLLWSLFMVVGLFNFVRRGGAFNLALATAGLALTWATHELVFILLFIGGTFFGGRMLWEWRPRVFWQAIAGALIFSVLFAVAYFGISREQWAAVYDWTHRFFGPVLMLGLGALLLAAMARGWEREPRVLQRFAAAWREERHVYWIALGSFLAIFALLFTTFFAYPRGFLDGWYAGIQYWLGSQHQYARGGQPWFYYLMLLPIYDLLALVFSLIGLGWLFTAGRHRLQPDVTHAAADHAPESSADGRESPRDGHESRVIHADRIDPLSSTSRYPLFVFFLGYWFVQAFVGFSWAGEKMPWLLTHISLPATIFAAWVLGILIDRVPWRQLRQHWGWAVPVLAIVALAALGSAVFAFAGGDQTMTGVRARLQGLIPAGIAGLCVFALLSIMNLIGTRVTLRLAALAIALLLLLYGVRAASLVVYRHPDVPIEPLIYTQTAPDVPILVRQIENLAINQTRNTRTADDPTGGRSMPLALDGGSADNGGEGSLAWPMQWYLRHYTNVRWVDPTRAAALPQDAVMLVLYKPHVTADVRAQLEADYIQTSEGVFNWWFPEFTGDPDPNRPGEPPARGYKSLALEGATGWQRVWNVISWPFTPSNWDTLWSYMIYRELPMELKGREMVVFVRRDAVPGSGAQAATTPTDTVVPEARLGSGQLNNPRGMTLDRDGNVLVADSANHRIVVLSQDGALVRTIGSLGNGPGQLNEPSGVAVDDEGNIYVADTWNARVAKFDAAGNFLTAWGTGGVPFGPPFIDPATGQEVQRYAVDNGNDPLANEQHPLGFFGPRNVAVHGERVYIADTGNSRIVVTDLEGRFIEQIGVPGAGVGQLREPIGLAFDAQDRLYVGDTWNGRIQVFQINGDGVASTPLLVIAVPGWSANTYFDPFIAVGADGRLWASQGARNTITEWDSNGAITRRIRTEPTLQGPKGVFWAGGALYVVNSGAQEVLRLPAP